MWKRPEPANIGYRDIAGRPGGVSGYPRSWYRSVSWVRAPPSAYKYSYKFFGTFPCAQIDLRKARERELATLDEKSTSSGIAEPYARWKMKARTGGEKGRYLRLVQKLESRSVKKKEKKAACAAGVVTGTGGRDSSRYRYHGNWRTSQKTSWIANAIELIRHTTCTKISGSVMSLSFIFPHLPEDEEKKKDRRA